MPWIRGVLFYALYGPGMVVYTTLFLVLGPLLTARSRHALAQRLAGAILTTARTVAGIRYRIHGRENLPDTPCVVCANHESAWETYLLGWLIQPQSAVLKKELLAIPFYGWAVRHLSPIAIDRNRPTTAIKQLLRQGSEALKAGRWVVIYPEGTRVRPGETVRYNKGAASLAIRNGVPIVPVAHNAGDCWPRGTVAKYPGTVQVVLGPPIPTQGRRPDDVMADVESWIRKTRNGLSARPS